MIRTLLKITFAILVLIATTVGGWFLGFRDGITRAYADTGMSLATYFQAIQDDQPEFADSTLNTLTQNTVVHLLNGQHHWPLYFENPYRAQGILSELRAAWAPAPNLPPWGGIMLYPHEKKSSDYEVRFQEIVPVSPEKQISKRRPKKYTEQGAAANP